LKIPINKIQKKYDLIIIGAGVTGLTILYNLLEKKLNKKVLVLEYGSLFSKDPYPEKFNIISSNLKIKKNSRYFGVGGGSNVWGPLHGLLDKTKVNKFFADSKFPINYNDYIKYINKASLNYSTPNSNIFNLNEKKYKNYKFRKLIKNKKKIKFSRYSSLLESVKVDFVDNAFVKKLKFNRKIDKVVVKPVGRKNTIEISGNRIILSAGTLENIRILHKSYKKIPTNLGKGFMDHASGLIGSFKSNNKIFKNFLKKKINENFESFIGIQNNSDNSTNTYLRIKKGINYPIIYKLFHSLNDKILTDKNLVIKFFTKVFQRLLIILLRVLNFYNKGYYTLNIHCELKNNENNFVKLNKNRLIVNYKIEKNQIDEIYNFLKKFEKDFKIKIFPKFNKKNLQKLIFMDAGHHMGGLGMGKDNNSLINNNLKVKKSNGTYVTGGAIFNFNDSINPSLSYIALSIYLSDQLYKRK